MRTVITMLLLMSMAAAARPALADDEQSIRQLLVTSYVEGVFITRDRDAVEAGFHPDFMMHVYADGTLIQAPLAMWLERLQLDGTRNQDTIEHEFILVDVTGNTALAKMHIFENSKHLYTDYFGLYRFEDGWRIVNKIFFEHG